VGRGNPLTNLLPRINGKNSLGQQIPGHTKKLKTLKDLLPWKIS